MTRATSATLNDFDIPDARHALFQQHHSGAFKYQTDQQNQQQFGHIAKDPVTNQLDSQLLARCPHPRADQSLKFVPKLIKRRVRVKLRISGRQMRSRPRT